MPPLETAIVRIAARSARLATLATLVGLALACESNGTDATPTGDTATATPPIVQTTSSAPIAETPGATSTSTPTPAATAAVTPSATATPEVTATPPPTEGFPFDGADLVNRLAELGLSYAPLEHGYSCSGAAGSLGVVYGTAEGGFPSFILWVYETPATLQADWELPEEGPPEARRDDCPFDSGFAYWNENLLLTFGDDRVWAEHIDVRALITAAFLGLRRPR
jgi:hypothetical protein